MKFEIKHLADGFYLTRDGRYEFLKVNNAPPDRRWVLTEKRANGPDRRLGGFATWREAKAYAKHMFYRDDKSLKVHDPKTWKETVLKAGELINVQPENVRRAALILMRHSWRSAIVDFQEREPDLVYDEDAQFNQQFAADETEA